MNQTEQLIVALESLAQAQIKVLQRQTELSAEITAIGATVSAIRADLGCDAEKVKNSYTEVFNDAYARESAALAEWLMANRIAVRRPPSFMVLPGQLSDPTPQP